MKNNKGFIGLGLILTIIAVLAIGGGAYYLGTKNNSAPKSVKENNFSQESQNQNAVTQNLATSYKTPCNIKNISHYAFSFEYPEGYSINEIKPIEGNVPGGGIMNINIQPKDGSSPITIGALFEACEFTGYKLCKGVSNGYSIYTNNNNSEVISAYNKILSTIKNVTDCK